MGLKFGRSPPSTRSVSLLCIASFCLGVFVVNWLLTVPCPVRTVDEAISGEHMSHILHPVLKCQKKDTSMIAGGTLFQVSRIHDVVMGFDKTISSLEMKLAAARAAKAENEKISTVDRKAVIESLNSLPKLFFIMGIMTAFSSRKRRDSIRETWMPQGKDLRKLEKEKAIIIRFVIRHSATPGGVLDRAIDAEDKQHKDFFRLNHVEGYHETVAKWDADFFIKVDDDVHVNLGVVGSLLDRHRSKPHVYVCCMKSGPVLSQKHILHRYVNEDVSLGSWFIGINVEHIDERSLCCGTPLDCEWKAQDGNTCAASFDWSCSGVCKSVERMEEVHQRCGEGNGAIWHMSVSA
ncbi:unnamed protein product [Withania somnifera]